MANKENNVQNDINQDYLAQMLLTMQEQTLICKQLLEKAVAMQSSGTDKSKKIDESSKKFSPKEIKELPYLKNCRIRYHRGVYEVRYRKHGVEKYFTHKTLTGAKEKARAYLANVNNTLAEILGQPITKNTKASINSAEFCEYWLQNYKARKIKPVSFKAMMSRYKNHLEPVLKKFTLKNLSAPVLQKIFDNVSTKNAEELRTILNGMFEYAIASGLIDRSPMPVIIIKKHERQIGERLSKEQERNLLDAVKGTEIETTIKLFLYTGARPSELKTITFDWQNGTFTLLNSKLKSYQKETSRTVPIFPTLYSIKEEIDACKIVNEAYISKYFWSRNMGFQVKSLRHTFTSKCKEQGVLPELVNFWTGHTPGKDTSARIYTHFEMDFQKNEAKKVVY